MKSKEAGFTLIELISGLIILAILAIVAAPKFINYSYHSYVSQAEGIAANFEQGVKFTQYQWIARGDLTAQTDIEGYSTDELDVNASGFPLGIKKRRALAQPNNIGLGVQGCNDLWNNLLVNPPTVTHKLNLKSDFLSVRYSSGVHQDSCYYINRSYGFNSAQPTFSDIKISYNSANGTVIVIANNTQ